jgi:gliding motility-associated-like protein
MADPEVQCEPAIVNFTAQVSKPANTSVIKYNWWFGNGQSLLNSTTFAPQNIPYDTAKRTWYDVSLKVENVWGVGANEVCAIQKDSIGYIKILPQPKADFSSDPGYNTTVAFPKFNFKNEGTIRWSSPGKLEHLWNFGTGDADDTSTKTNAVFSYPADTNKYRVHLSSIYTYTYKLIDQICIDTIGKVREIDPDVTVFVPTAFSPERSGPRTNNVFKAIVNGEKTFHIDLYNRWGQMLWTTDDKNASWDGTFMGEDVQQDVYTWVIKVTAFDGEVYTYEGTVTLLR